MDNAVALANPQSLATTGFGAKLAALPVKSRVTLGLGVAALIAVLAAITLWSSQGDYKVLYANLSDKDGGAIIAQLSQMNIPYRYTEGGGAILVPASQVHDLRLKLASAGLPKGSVVGYELMDGARFGQTQFQERLTFQRGLEGELTRSIMSMPAVQNARVHLALPNQNGFFREQQKPSASVMLTLYSGRTLDRGQVAGIVHLVSSSVPEMSPKAVSVLDQTGALLSNTSDASSGAGLDAQQLQYVNQIESGYNKRILDILEPVVGRDNLRAQVTADVDFAQIESTSEEFKPNQGPNAAATVRSMQNSEQSGSNGSSATGIPGATSNQPPVPATAPVTGAAQPLQTAQGGQGGGTSNSRRDAVTNYEVDKTVKVTRNATGAVRRLNAAVVINNRSVTDAKGKTTSVPLTPEELEKIETLVRESVGFNKDRGDSVKVINAPFKVEVAPKDDTPLWKQPQTIDLLRGAAVPVSLALLGLVIVFSLIRPALKTAQANAAAQAAANARGSKLDAVVDDEESLPTGAGQGALKIEGPKASAHLAGARVFAKENPAAVANIVRSWVKGETE
jgi:flagellar M-ring protein FliF